MKTYEAYKAIAEQALREALPKAGAYDGTIIDAASFSLLAGGKRMRPVLVLAAAEYCGADESTATAFAAAADMIHSYSLIHDDLPALDNDDLRRGKPTNHVVYGEAMAVIAGDALLNLAAETMASAALCAKEPLAALRAMQALLTASGIKGMVGGQAMDVLCEKQGTKPDEAALHYIHTHKTGALIRGCVQAGALLGNAGESVLTCLTRYAEALGEAFQIADDILDVTSSKEVLGKSIGKDALEGKLTYVSRFGLDGACERLCAKTQEALDALNTLPNAQWFIEFAESMRDRVS